MGGLAYPRKGKRAPRKIIIIAVFGFISLSPGVRVISCQVSEFAMISASHCSTDGHPRWSVSHNEQNGLWNIDTSGDPPPQLQAIQRRCFAEQARSKRDTKFPADFIFDVPVERASSIVGYRHDFFSYSSGTPQFTAIERVR